MGKLDPEYQAEYSQREGVKARKAAWRKANPDKELARKRRWREANREKSREYQRRWREENRERVAAQKRERYEARRTEILEYQRKRYAENREELREYNRRYYQANRDELMLRAKRWAQENPGKVRGYGAVRRARELEQPCDLIDYLVVFDRDKGICGICGLPVEPEDWHLDHIVPLSKGGHHLYENVQVSHPTCNLRKGTSVPS